MSFGEGSFGGNSPLEGLGAKCTSVITTGPSWFGFENDEDKEFLDADPSTGGGNNP